ncbi:MAG: PorP/SprF family type IX secretion system membrane protein [Bacteroidales bacterium]|nr:PorP/SprF family type IX secretion system membrane protein [Bacteroidales bacterium]
MKHFSAYIFLLILLSCQPAYSQDFHFSGFLHNQVYLNPSYVAIPAMNEVSMTYRNQWPGIPANFVTYGASFIQPISVINSGTGLVFLRDSEGGGVFIRTSASLYYGYSFKVNRRLQMYTGIGASYVFRQFNPENLTFASDILNDLGGSYPPVYISAYTRGYPDFSAGFTGKHSNGFTLGGAVFHVTRPKESFSGERGSRLPVKYCLFSSYKMRAGGKYNRRGVLFTPALLYIHQGKTNELLWGTAAEIRFITAGIWLRHNLSLDFSSLVLSAGILQKKYTFLYSYDVNLTRADFLLTKMGSHEVTFLYRFKYKKKKIKAVKCP